MLLVLLLLLPSSLLGSSLGETSSEEWKLLELVRSSPWLVPRALEPRHPGMQPLKLQHLGSTPQEYESAIIEDDVSDFDSSLERMSTEGSRRGWCPPAAAPDKRSAVAMALRGAGAGVAGPRQRRLPPEPRAAAPVGSELVADVERFLVALESRVGELAQQPPGSAGREPHLLTALQPPPPQDASSLHYANSGSSGSGGASGGGRSLRRFHALTPLRPSYNFRSQERRSVQGARASLLPPQRPQAASSARDPELLWTGLGR